MTRKSISLLAKVGCVGMATPATAKSSDPDVWCLILSKFFIVKGTDTTRKTPLSAKFFLGRLDARLSADQLKAQIMSPSNNVRRLKLAQP